MAPARLTLRAQRDVRAAVAAISADSRSAARRFQVLLRLRLGDYPEIGTERHQIIGPPYRFAAFRGFPYLAVYDPSLRPPLIVRVPHGAQDPSNLLRDLPQNDA